MVPVRCCFCEDFAGLSPSAGWQLYHFKRTVLILMWEWLVSACEALEINSQWIFSAKNQSNLAWGNWVKWWQILPFEVIKNHTSESPLMSPENRSHYVHESRSAILSYHIMNLLSHDLLSDCVPRKNICALNQTLSKLSRDWLFCPLRRSQRLLWFTSYWHKLASLCFLFSRKISLP